MKKHGFLITASIIIVILLIFLLLVKLTKSSYEEISFDDISTVETGVVYIGGVDDSVKQIFKGVRKTFNISSYNVASAELEDINSYLSDNDLDEIEDSAAYIFINDSKPVWVSSKEDFDETELTASINKYVYGVLLDSEIVYKVPTDGDELVNKINSKKYTVFVIGKSDCNYCQLYIPVFNQVAKDNDLDIYYVDVDEYSSTEYQKITDLNLDIPAECTTTGVATTTEGSFPKPMTLITKNGKTVDCILGYASETKLTDKLIEYGIIK